MNRGGHSCAMDKCPNISGRVPGLSFFRFPKDAKRCELWLKNCGRTFQVPTENLYKTYRVCENHFDSTMFLNDLKNRLQPHAVPKLINVPINKYKGENELAQNDESLLKQSFHTISSDNHISSLCNAQDTIIINENNQKNQKVQTTQISVTQDEEIQTDCTLSRNSSRKIILKKKIRSLQKKLRKVQKQLIEQKTSSTKNFKKPSLLEYCDATDQLLPPPIASFVKAQLYLSQKLPMAQGVCAVSIKIR